MLWYCVCLLVLSHQHPLFFKLEPIFVFIHLLSIFSIDMHLFSWKETPKISAEFIRRRCTDSLQMVPTANKLCIPTGSASWGQYWEQRLMMSSWSTLWTLPPDLILCILMEFFMRRMQKVRPCMDYYPLLFHLSINAWPGATSAVLGLSLPMPVLPPTSSKAFCFWEVWDWNWNWNYVEVEVVQFTMVVSPEILHHKVIQLFNQGHDQGEEGMWYVWNK